MVLKIEIVTEHWTTYFIVVVLANVKIMKILTQSYIQLVNTHLAFITSCKRMNTKQKNLNYYFCFLNSLIVY